MQGRAAQGKSRQYKAGQCDARLGEEGQSSRKQDRARLHKFSKEGNVKAGSRPSG